MGASALRVQLPFSLTGTQWRKSQNGARAMPHSDCAAPARYLQTARNHPMPLHRAFASRRWLLAALLPALLALPVPGAARDDHDHDRARAALQA